jgi:hypothetical protein
MDTQLRQDFRHFLYNGPSMMTGRQAEMALRDARTLREWRELESEGKVRMVMEPEEENYFDVYGEPDTEKERKSIVETLDRLGCYWVAAEYLTACDNDEHEVWEQADSIGMCVYEDATDPFENCYVIQLMQSAIDAVKEQSN